MPVKFVAAALAVIAGLIGNALPEAFRTAAVETVLTPVSNTVFATAVTLSLF